MSIPRTYSSCFPRTQADLIKSLLSSNWQAKTQIFFSKSSHLRSSHQHMFWHFRIKNGADLRTNISKKRTIAFFHLKAKVLGGGRQLSAPSPNKMCHGCGSGFSTEVRDLLTDLAPRPRRWNHSTAGSHLHSPLCFRALSACSHHLCKPDIHYIRQMPWSRTEAFQCTHCICSDIFLFFWQILLWLMSLLLKVRLSVRIWRHRSPPESIIHPFSSYL